MPWVQIDASKLELLGLFGYDKIKEDGDGIWQATPFGRHWVNKADPRIYLDDINDIMQLAPKTLLIESAPNGE